ncbi:MAG: hypothetical protein CVU44_01795 [Chloroflexi bacterium HGW-Chloroflexi-6]|nr:MAG: hypothetical protein CVU44_01795 [Chloroflexi bacterium HGW-Chloroflexi-6]
MQDNKNIVILIVLAGAVIILALGIFAGALLLNGPTECGTGDSNYFDLLRARSYITSAFEPDVWKASYSVLPYRVNVTWDAPDISALATLEYLIFNCGYTDADLEDYYSEANFYQIILSGYDNPQKTNSCRSGDLRLYEFSAEFSGQEYLLAQWAKPDGKKRAAGFFMAFPAENAAGMLAYAEKIFPELPTCP